MRDRNSNLQTPWYKSLWKSCELTQRDRRNQQITLIWLFLWMLTWVGANIAIKEGWAGGGAPALFAALLPTLLGLAVIFAYWKFIREADELQRKIHLDALALGFGIGVVGAYTLHLLALLGIIDGLDISTISAVMMVSYATGVVFGVRRYA